MALRAAPPRRWSAPRQGEGRPCLALPRPKGSTSKAPNHVRRVPGACAPAGPRPALPVSIAEPPEHAGPQGQSGSQGGRMVCPGRPQRQEQQQANDGQRQPEEVSPGGVSRAGPPSAGPMNWDGQATRRGCLMAR